jgi:hypothetical protein
MLGSFRGWYKRKLKSLASEKAGGHVMQAK